MMAKQEIIHWLESLCDNTFVGVDQGGLCLRAVRDDILMEDEWLDIGGIPKEIEEMED